MRKPLMVASAALFALAMSAIVLAQGRVPVKVKAGDEAPMFTADASDGKRVELKSLLTKGPVFLYFVKDHCSANPAAVPEFNKLYEAYGKSVQFVGVMNTGKEGHKEWKGSYKGTYNVVLDASKKIIGDYGVRTSQSVVMVGKDGKVQQVFVGYGRDNLAALSKAMATEAKMPEKALDFSAAPKGVAYG